ncbi:hypothetical protein SGLAM104S_02988 [Streptomyces glaucescens]
MEEAIPASASTEVRRCPGWYRYITLAMPAHAFLAAVAAQATEAGPQQRPHPTRCRP